MLLALLLAIALPVSTGCAWWQANKEDVKTVVQTVDQIAQNLCGIFYGDKLQINVTEAIKVYCDSREKYAPWIDQVLAGSKAGGDAKLTPKSKTYDVVLIQPTQTTPASPLLPPVTPLGSPWAATPPPATTQAPETVVAPAKGKP
jgi:hypothetical protein